MFTEYKVGQHVYCFRNICYENKSSGVLLTRHALIIASVYHVKDDFQFKLFHAF